MTACDESVLVIGGPILDGDVPRLCAQARGLLCGGAEVIVCDVGAVTDPDLGTVDALAHLQLTAQRLGGKIRVRHASSRLRELLSLAGLADVMAGDLRVDVRRESEEPEQPGGVEEGVHHDDLTG